MRRWRWWLVASLALALALTARAGADPGPSGPAGARCEQLELPVAIGGARGPLAATLCAPPQADALQVLVHDATYDRTYWDFPYAAPAYSHVAAANAAGFATLAIDRIGAGASWKPPSDLVTFEAQAGVLHQVVQAARRGDLGRPYTRVAVVGHGVGALLGLLEAGDRRDVDALVITGATHGRDLGGVARLRAGLVPAIDDALFADSALDAGYLTTPMGGRPGLLHDGAEVDPGVLARDENLKQTVTVTELQNLNAEAVFAASTQVSIPVLVVAGALDPAACGPQAADCSSSRTLAEFEQRFLGDRAQVEALVLPRSGRALGLEHHARVAYAVIDDFLARHL